MIQPRNRDKLTSAKVSQFFLFIGSAMIACKTDWYTCTFKCWMGWCDHLENCLLSSEDCRLNWWTRSTVWSDYRQISWPGTSSIKFDRVTHVCLQMNTNYQGGRSLSTVVKVSNYWDKLFTKENNVTLMSRYLLTIKLNTNNTWDKVH